MYRQQGLSTQPTRGQAHGGSRRPACPSVHCLSSPSPPVPSNSQHGLCVVRVQPGCLEPRPSPPHSGLSSPGLLPDALCKGPAPLWGIGCPWAHLGLWDMAEDVRLEEVWLCGQAGRCLSMAELCTGHRRRLCLAQRASPVSAHCPAPPQLALTSPLRSQWLRAQALLPGANTV